VLIETGSGNYFQTVVEKQLMQQDVTMNAAGMASSIADTGSVAVYGINFDTAKSDIKPDSEPAIDEIAKLLTNNPALKVGIVGHTDMVGDATGTCVFPRRAPSQSSPIWSPSTASPPRAW
jgi:OOP family OmpA-OmpF porin